MRQLVTESVLLSLTGGAAGLLIALSSARVVMLALPPNLLQTPSPGLSLPVLFFALGVSGLAGILFGLAPALRTSKIDLETSLKEDGRGSSTGQHRAQSALVISDPLTLGTVTVVLIGAALLACYLPARRAARMDPLAALRHD